MIDPDELRLLHIIINKECYGACSRGTTLPSDVRDKGNRKRQSTTMITDCVFKHTDGYMCDFGQGLETVVMIYLENYSEEKLFEVLL